MDEEEKEAFAVLTKAMSKLKPNFNANHSVAYSSTVVNQLFDHDDEEDDEEDTEKVAEAKLIGYLNSISTQSNQPANPAIHHIVSPGGGSTAGRGKAASLSFSLPKNRNTKGGTQMNLYVQDVNISVSETDFIEIVEDMSVFNHKKTSTKTGKTVIQVEDPNSNGAGELLAVVENHMVNIKPHKFGNKNYVTASENILELLCIIASAHSGDLACSTKCGPKLYKKGRSINAEYYIVEKGTAPKTVVEEDESPQFTVTKPIKQYLEENQTLYSTIKPMTFPDNLNYVARHLLQEKINGNLEFNDFKSLVGQVIVLGANEPKVKQLYDFIK